MRVLKSLVAGWLLLVSVVVAEAGVMSAKLVERENVVDVQRVGGAWRKAEVGQTLEEGDKIRTGEYSRATLQLTDLSMLRVDELSTIVIRPPVANGGQRTLEQERGGSYFFSRDKAQEIQIRTPSANGALRGTEFELRVAGNGKTRLTMFDGKVELWNRHGSLTVSGGEQAEVEVGRAPRKTAMLEATNIMQWCLYYPAVLDPAELSLGAAELDAYRSGDLPAALAADLRHAVPKSIDGKLLRAALRLSSGQVEKARAALAGVPAQDSRRLAIEQLIAAVKLQPWPRAAEPRTASEWLAESYFQQSRHDLEAARRAARRAVETSPQFGFAQARLAELEFSFGRTLPAQKTLEQALELAPRNAQAHALQGYLFSAENRMGAAARSFQTAIDLDGALGNAWLGRGLVAIRQGRSTEGRNDLHAAAVLEPNRAIFRSYLGKAFSNVGIDAKANLEFARAKEIDPADPTPWLYSALQRQQENRYNESIDDLEHSVALNDNRRVYRSQFLLDQDRAVRGANLAAIYEKDGLTDQSVREATRAVTADYASAPAHLFLSNSYNALRDPNRVLLRYENAWQNELLLANLLSPVGGSSLSQFVSQQEYSKLLESDGVGILSLFEYSSDGKVREVASQYGTVGRLSYALDGEYYFDNGLRPNNAISRFESYATFKLQLGPQDTLFLQASYLDSENGDVFQRYDQREVGREITTFVSDFSGTHKVVQKNVASLTYDYEEKQEPGPVLAGWHHEWAPGQHTVLLAGRLASNISLNVQDLPVLNFQRDLLSLVPNSIYSGLNEGTVARDSALFSLVTPLGRQANISNGGTNVFDLDYRSSFETFSAELQQIITVGPHTAVAGARGQTGQFDTSVTLSDFRNGDLFSASLFPAGSLRRREVVDLERVGLYFYDTWRVAPWLTLIGGVTYDSLKYPDNFRVPPINGRQRSEDELSPKAGVIIEPWSGATLRAAYTEALAGPSFDDGVRLEPTQVGGFLQSYRTLISESLVGSVAGSKYKLSGLSFEQKLPTRTYFAVEFNSLQQDLDRTLGVVESLYTFGTPLVNSPDSTNEKDIYREDRLTVSLNQLLGGEWSVGANYRFTHSQLRQQLTGVTDSLSRALKNDFLVTNDAGQIAALAALTDRRTASNFHEVHLFALYNHPSGFFARGEANWYHQDNDSFTLSPVHPVAGDVDEPHPRLRTQNRGLPGEDIWQLNLLVGYRFGRNRNELSLGLLNLTGTDYQFSPISPYAELPRDRTLFVRCKIEF